MIETLPRCVCEAEVERLVPSVAVCTACDTIWIDDCRIWVRTLMISHRDLVREVRGLRAEVRGLRADVHGLASDPG